MNERMPPRTRSRGGRPPKHEAGAAGIRIIEAATQLFASQGYAGTSVEQVAATCGVGKDTIYRRFPSKAALFDGVVEHARTRVAGKIEDLAVGRGGARTPLKDLLRQFLALNMQRDLVALKRIAFSEAVVAGRKGAIPSSPPDPLMEILVKAVKAGQTEGALRDGDAAFMAAYLIHGLVSIPTTHAMLGGTDFDDAGTLDAYFDTVWTWLAEGVAAR